MPTQLSPLEAQARLAADPQAVYLDVRSTPEFAAGHPPGAYNIPLLEADPATGMLLPNALFVEQVRAHFSLTTPIIAGCRSGARSMQAGTLLMQAGFQEVFNLEGGFLGAGPGAGSNMTPGWTQAGLPVEFEVQPGHDFASLQQPPDTR